MAFTSPPPAPQRGDRTTFSSRVDAFLLWLAALIPQMNTFLSSITALAAGGANSFVYTFDTGTADSDPGTGKLRLGSSTQNTAVVMRIDSVAGNGGDVTAFLLALQAGTSNVKASVRLQKVGDATTYLLFDITGVSNASGYLNLTLTPRTSTSTSPFAANDTLAVFFDPKGDRGDGGNTPTQAEIIAAVGTLPISSGGTGGTTQATARTSLGVAAATSVVLLGQANQSAGTRFISAAPPTIAAMNGNQGQEDNVPMIVSNGGNNNASSVIQFLRQGTFAAFFGVDTDNKLKFGGYSLGNNAYEIWHQANFNPANYASLSGANFSGSISAPVVTQTSDERKKTNWRKLTNEQMDALASMQNVGLFDWIEGAGEGSSVGGSAQEIQRIVPEAVHEHIDLDGNTWLTVNYGGLCFAMAQAALSKARGYP